MYAYIYITTNAFHSDFIDFQFRDLVIASAKKDAISLITMDG